MELLTKFDVRVAACCSIIHLAQCSHARTVELESITNKSSSSGWASGTCALLLLLPSLGLGTTTNTLLQSK